jgi:hypothetical protein
MATRLRHLITENTGVVVLQVVPLSASCRPKTTMKGEPKEQLHLRRRLRLNQTDDRGSLARKEFTNDITTCARVEASHIPDKHVVLRHSEQM